MSSHVTLRQISLHQPDLQDVSHITEADHDEETRQFRNALRRNPSWSPHNKTLSSVSPFPIVVPEYLVDHLKKLGDSLGRAVTSIVDRWWTDPVADFPSRMPLLEHQEKLLKWVDGDGRKMIPTFARKCGVWRPDFLLTSARPRPNQAAGSVQICEINARFAFNAFFSTAYAQIAYQETDLESHNLRSPVDPEKIFSAFEALVDPTKPIHLLKGKEDGYDIHHFYSYLTQSGYDVRYIKPEDLRRVTIGDEGQQRVHCTAVQSQNRKAEGKYEQIYQVALELHQRELEELGEDMLKALAPICFNDFRTIHLVHDKRMLGIVRQELDSLVHENILTPDEADLLRDGIAPTFIPGSTELHKLLGQIQKGVSSKDDYLLKAVSSGKGKGIIFGTDLSDEEFIKYLKRLSMLKGNAALYVVQPVIQQPRYNLVIPKNNTKAVVEYQLVGTFMMVNGEHLGIGQWRASPDRICAISRGGGWMCSLMETSTNGTKQKRIAQDSKEANQKDINGTTISSNPPNTIIERLTISSQDQATSPIHVKIINTILHSAGILILDLAFPDPSSSYLLSLITALQESHGHNPPLTHSSTRGYFWDVKPLSHEIPTASTSPSQTASTQQLHIPTRVSSQPLARSETSRPFLWHTDCSYTPAPPQFFALQVLHADAMGGGTLAVLPLPSLLSALPMATIAALRAPEFQIAVPAEFASGDAKAVVGALLSSPVSTPQSEDGKGSEGADRDGGEMKGGRVRFRADIITPLTPRASSALHDFQQALEDARGVDLTAEVLPSGSLVLLDNGRWLHARNEIRDRRRWLRRIRWDGRVF